MENKTGKYLKYAIGEIVLVVIGILIALSINNWNEKQKEEKQIRNIYARVVKDFENTAIEIEGILQEMNVEIPLMQRLMKEEVNRDSLLNDRDYFNKFFTSTNGFPDIQIHDKSVRMLESKIGLNYELSTEFSEALILLYSEFLYEINISREDATIYLRELLDYKMNKGIEPPNLVKNGTNRVVDMIYEDDVYKHHSAVYLATYINFRNKLRSFKTQGEALINEIKTEYNLE